MYSIVPVLFSMPWTGSEGAITYEQIRNNGRYRRDKEMGLKCPSYGELVWWEMNDLTPVITVNLDDKYNMCYRLRKFAHELNDMLPINHARATLLKLYKVNEDIANSK